MQADSGYYAGYNYPPTGDATRRDLGRDINVASRPISNVRNNT